MNMPGITGIEVAEHIKTIKEQTPVILCSGFTDDDMDTHAKSAGISEILLKPFTSAELARTVEKVISKSATRVNR
jgi:FixJ family two-component response regulator